MRGLAEAFAAAGFAVELPRLPGHGTSVEDLLTTRFPDWAAAIESSYIDLAGRCDEVVVAGLSMGGTLAAWLAARHPRIAGLVTINGMFQPPAPEFGELLRQALAQGIDRVPSIGSDIADRSVKEEAYEAAPIEPMLSFFEGQTELYERLPEIRCPVLILSSNQDHVVPPVSADVLTDRVSGTVERINLERSYHVATLDYDKDIVVEQGVKFALRVTAR
jgi:carboxylesterase